MSPLPRRGFLSGLVSLPLIRGGVTLIGQPTAAAVPITPELLDSYETWLDLERNALRVERYGYDDPAPFVDHEIVFRQRSTGYVSDWIRLGNAGSRHFSRRGSPSARAAVILSAAGVPIEGGS